MYNIAYLENDNDTQTSWVGYITQKDPDGFLDYGDYWNCKKNGKTPKAYTLTDALKIMGMLIDRGELVALVPAIDCKGKYPELVKE